MFTCCSARKKKNFCFDILCVPGGYFFFFFEISLIIFYVYQHDLSIYKTYLYTFNKKSYGDHDWNFPTDWFQDKLWPSWCKQTLKGLKENI